MRFNSSVFSLCVAAAITCLSLQSHAQQASEPKPAMLTNDEVSGILNQAEEAAKKTASAEGLRSNSDAAKGDVAKRSTKMIICVVDRDGTIRGLRQMKDAWVGSKDIAIAKARTAAFFSSNENALTSRIIGELSQPSKPDGSGGAGPLWGIGNSNQAGISGGQEIRNGIITFPGGIALYKGGNLVGGIGVSGDAVDQDEAVAFGGTKGYEPGKGVVSLGYKAPTVPTVD